MRYAALFALSTAMVGCSPTPDPAQLEQDEKYGAETEAKLEAERAVRRYVKFPDDAQFGFDQQAQLASDVGGQRNWVVTGSVRERTPGGAKVTNQYQVTMKYEGPDNWDPLAVMVAGEYLFKTQAAVGRQVADATVLPATPPPLPALPAKPPETAMPVEPALPLDRPSETAAGPVPIAEMPEQVTSAPAEAVAESPIDAPAEPPPPTLVETPAEPVPDLRTWTSTAGTTIEAEFAGYSAGNVKLRKADGTLISVPLDRLSTEDQKFIRNKR